MTGYRNLLVERADHVLTVTLHRPDRLNAVDNVLTAELLDLLTSAEPDDDVRAVVLTGAGRGFCAGADVADLASASGQDEPAELRRRMRQGPIPLARALLDFEKPLIAAVNGPCAGAGVGIALACDIVLASEQATFTLAFVRRGLVPDYATTYLLPRLVGLRVARELCLLGETVDAARADALGLVTRVVPADDLLAVAEEYAQRLAAGPGAALGLTKRLLASSFEVDAVAALDREFSAQALCLAGADAAEGAAAFLEKREPRFGVTMSRRVVDGIVPERDRNAEGRAENARPRDRFGRPLPYGMADEMAERNDPAEVVSTLAEALREAAALFDQQRFFEAHEFLEWVWKSDEIDPADRDYWKGVTQVAVGFAHTQRGNDSGARTLLQRAQRYMAPYPSPHAGVDRDALSAGAGAVIEQIDSDGASPEVTFPRFPLSPG